MPSCYQTFSGGGGNLWADTTNELSLKGKAVETPSESFFTVAKGDGAASFSSGKYTGKYNGTSYDNALKMESSTTIQFTTTAKRAVVTVVQCTKTNSEDNTGGIKLDKTDYAYNADVVTTPSDDDNSQVRVYTINDVAAGTHTIARYGSESGLFYVKVVQLSTDFTLYSSLPYEWKFYDDEWWATTDQVLESSSYWYSENVNNSDAQSTWKNNEVNAASGKTLHTADAATILPETNNLTFGNSDNRSRVGVIIGDHLWLGSNTSLSLPSLPAGAKVIVRAAAHTSNKTLAVANASETALNLTTAAKDFEMTVSSEGQVTLTNNSGTHVYIYAIKVEKIPTTLTHRDLTDISGTTLPYQADERTFNVTASFSPNVLKNASNAADTNPIAVNGTNFSAVSSNPDVIKVGIPTYDSDDQLYFTACKVGTKAGTAVVTFKFNGTENYEASSYDLTFTVAKGDPTFNFGDYNLTTPYTVTYTGNDFPKVMAMNLSAGVTLATDGESSSEKKAHNITFTSNDTHTATIDQYTGKITIQNAGSTVIKAVFAGNDNYNAATAYFRLEVTGTAPTETLSWNTTDNTPATPPSQPGYVEKKSDDNAFAYTATASNGATVKYKISDSDLAQVNVSTGDVTPKYPGVVTVTAYTEGTAGQQGAELTYELHINGGEIALGFSPTSGTVTRNMTIMPRLVFPTITKADITYLTAESADATVATVPANLLQNEYLEMQDYRIDKVYLPIKGLKVGTTTITVRFKSPYYNGGEELTATYTVTVTDQTLLHSWAPVGQSGQDKRDYTIVTGEYMMMPAISGNSNGNIDGLSKGSVCAARHGYVYMIKGASRTITWNNKNYYYGEGYPDFTLTPAAINGGQGYIYWASGNDSNSPALMIYGESAGDLILRATDSQTGQSCGDITIHVVDKAERVTGPEATFWDSHRLPFTWDFTNIPASAVTDDVTHWKNTLYNNASDTKAALKGQHVLGMATLFNYDYSDEDRNNIAFEGANGSNTRQVLKKYFVNGEDENCQLMPQFYGLRLESGNSSTGSYWSKRDRVSLYDNTADDPRLYIEGGWHYLYLPAITSADKRPAASYRLYLKVKGTKDKGELNCFYMKADETATDGAATVKKLADGATLSKLSGDKEVLYVDIDPGKADRSLRLGFDQNVSIYWMGYSTEARVVKKDYNCATYAYAVDLDLSKTEEVADVKSYAITAVRGSNVVATPVTSAKAGEGILVIPNTAVTAASGLPVYFVAQAQNQGGYTAPTVVSDNMLKGVTTPTLVSAKETIDDVLYYNMGLSNKYKKVDTDDNDDIINASLEASAYTTANIDNLGFYRLSKDGTVAAQRSYLHMPKTNYSIGGMTFDTETQSAKGFGIIFDDQFVWPDDEPGETTAVSTVDASRTTAGDDHYYNLQGVRVAHLGKGIYIHKGRKVVVK